MLVVGERSGGMAEMMERIAGFYDEEMARWGDWFTRLFEPILMALIGVIIGGGVYLAALYVLRVPELTYLANGVLRRLKRS